MTILSDSAGEVNAHVGDGGSDWTLSEVVPTDPHDRHQLLRLAGGLALALHGPLGDAIAASVTSVGVTPATVERVVSSLRDYGVIALINGVLYALGVRAYLQDIGLRPRDTELRTAERIERTGATPFFVVAVARAQCLGVIGAPRHTNPSDPTITRSVR